MIADRRKGARNGESSRNSGVPVTGAQSSRHVRENTYTRMKGQKKGEERRVEEIPIGRERERDKKKARIEAMGKAEKFARDERK